MATYEKKKWEESEALKKQQEALEAYKDNKPSDYSSPNQQLSEDAFNKWQNYKQFNYDINADAIYNQYKNNYMTQGKLAMQDTIGQAAALTGGYGSSYGQSVGQQAYQGYLQKLNDVVPALQDAAYSRYSQDKQDAYNNWQALQALEAQDYSRYMDELNQYNTEYNKLYNEYNNAYGREYSQYQYEDQMAYQQYQDAVAQEQWQKQFDADQAYRSWQMANSGKAATTTTTGFDNGSVSSANIEAMQRYLGVPATGKWDTVSYNAAGGLTADQAWAQYNNTYNDIDTEELYRELTPNTAYINNYYAQTPADTNTSYVYDAGMYNKPLVPLENSQVSKFYDLMDYESDYVDTYLKDLAAQGYDTSYYWELYNKKKKSGM